MNRWTPADGPIEDALKDLPDGHPITIRGDWGELHGTIWGNTSCVRVDFGAGYRYMIVKEGFTSAEWEQPAPQWDGALVVADRDNEPWVRYPDGSYHYTTDLIRTADQLEDMHGPCRVLIDADGNYPGTDPCNRGACAAPLGHEGTCTEASGWETTDE